MSTSPRIAIITGASQGIGRATSLRLANNFTHLVLVARNEAALQETASQIKTQNPSVQTLPIAIDLSERASAEKIIKTTVETFQTDHIDAVINVAGAVSQRPLLSLTEEEWDAGFGLKLHGARRLTVAAWPYLRATTTTTASDGEGGGSVIFTSGTAAQNPKQAMAAVATVNAAIVALARAFADLGVAHGVQVNSILPGPVMTDRRNSYLRYWSADQGLSLEEATRIFPQKAGIQRFGRPEEIAGLIAYLTGPEARWLTGAAVRMDGGEVKGV